MLCRLTSLNLEGSSLAKVDVEAIGREMPHLEEIKVMQSTFDDELAQAFCRVHDRQRSRLRVFRVDGTEVSTDGVKVRPFAAFAAWLSTITA
jgi:hypothetical protein